MAVNVDLAQDLAVLIPHQNDQLRLGLDGNTSSGWSQAGG